MKEKIVHDEGVGKPSSEEVIRSVEKGFVEKVLPCLRNYGKQIIYSSGRRVGF